MKNTDKKTSQRLIAIEKLAKSPHNVRRTLAPDALDELKASILAHGLMHNLVVTDAGDGAYHVIDGARRLEALKALQEEGKLPEGFEAPCRIVAAADDTASELSLAANVIRLAMHPADEFEAFARLAESGLSPEKIGERFGKTARHVEQRLKLGTADPRLLAEYRAGTLNLDCLMAFTITDDRNKQWEVYQALSGGYRYDARQVRAALTESMAEANSKLAKFVGLDAYRKAGGTTRSDLFGEAVYLENPALLKALAEEKLGQAERELTKEGWKWIEVSHDRDWSLLSRFERTHPEPVNVPDELAVRIEKAAADHAALREQIEAADDEAELEALWTAEEEIEELRGRIEAEIAVYAAYSPEQLAIAGCHVSIGYQGELQIEKGLVRREDARRLAKEQEGEAGSKPKGLSATLMRDLELYRLQVAQIEIARNPALAFDLLAFKAATGALSHRPVSGLKIDLTGWPAKIGGTDTKAGEAFAAIRDALPVSWLDEDSEAARFKAFRSLTDGEKQAILAYCTSLTLQPELATGREETAYELALSLTGGNVADYWRPAAANFFGRIGKGQMLEIGRALLGESWASNRQKAKSKDLALQLERAFADPAGHGRNPEQVKALTDWLPEGMAFAAAGAEPEPQAKPRKKAARKAA